MLGLYLSSPEFAASVIFILLLLIKFFILLVLIMRGTKLDGNINKNSVECLFCLSVFCHINS